MKTKWFLLSGNLIILVLVSLLYSMRVYASQSILYTESQAVMKFSSEDSDLLYYSHQKYHPMQKTSIGVDYIKHLSSDYRDWGTLALQVRIAAGVAQGSDLELQLYNAYIKIKSAFSDIWFGHNSPSFGLSYVLDSHEVLLQPLAMEGFGFERDWGAGLYKSLESGDISLSLTTGSGMPIILNDNYLLNIRYSIGILERINRSLGISAATGMTAGYMGYKKIDDDSEKTALLSFDYSHNILNYEFKADSTIGFLNDKFSSAALLRISMKVNDDILRFEIQPVYTNKAESKNIVIYSGVSYRISRYLNLKLLESYDPDIGSHDLTTQLYYYRRI